MEPPQQDRTFGWKGMFVPRTRIRAPRAASAANARDLTGYLRDYRLTLELKCEGLDAEQMARRSVPSGLRMAGPEVPRLYYRKSSPVWTRTKNLPVNSRLLCQLSYGGPPSGLDKSTGPEG